MDKKGIGVELSDGSWCPVELVTMYRLPGHVPESEILRLAGVNEDSPILEKIVYGCDVFIDTTWQQVEVEGETVWEVVVSEGSDS